MKYIAIDYGTKKVGIAVSDGIVALPKEVLPNNSDLLHRLRDYIEGNEVTDVVVGESLDLSGGLNEVAGKAREFVAKLGASVEAELRVHYVDERFTTKQALGLPIEGGARGDIANKRGSKPGSKLADAQAAAIILQSFLDKQKNLS